MKMTALVLADGALLQALPSQQALRLTEGYDTRSRREQI